MQIPASQRGLIPNSAATRLVAAAKAYKRIHKLAVVLLDPLGFVVRSRSVSAARRQNMWRDQGDFRMVRKSTSLDDLFARLRLRLLADDDDAPRGAAAVQEPARLLAAAHRRLLRERRAGPGAAAAARPQPGGEERLPLVQPALPLPFPPASQQEAQPRAEGEPPGRTVQQVQIQVFPAERKGE